MVETNFPRGKTNQKHYPGLGSDVTSMEFPRSFLRRLWRGNQWWRPNLVSRLVASLFDMYIQRILSRFLDNMFRRSGSFVKSPGWLSCHLITKLILVAFKLRCQDLDKAIAESRAMERITFLSLSIWIQILPKKRSTRFTHSNDVTWQPPWSCFYF